jgi:hypothetical protein
MDQFQFCNTNADPMTCTNLTGSTDVNLETARLGYNQAQNFTAGRLLLASGYSQTYTGFIDLGAEGEYLLLSARQYQESFPLVYPLHCKHLVLTLAGQ